MHAASPQLLPESTVVKHRTAADYDLLSRTTNASALRHRVIQAGLIM